MSENTTRISIDGRLTRPLDVALIRRALDAAGVEVDSMSWARPGTPTDGIMTRVQWAPDQPETGP